MGHHHHDHHHHHHHHDHHGHHHDSPYDNPLLSCIFCPCYMVGSIMVGLARCAYVACYPFLSCLGFTDEHRHHHHHFSHCD